MSEVAQCDAPSFTKENTRRSKVKLEPNFKRRYNQYSQAHASTQFAMQAPAMTSIAKCNSPDLRILEKSVKASEKSDDLKNYDSDYSKLEEIIYSKTIGNSLKQAIDTHYENADSNAKKALLNQYSELFNGLGEVLNTLLKKDGITDILINGDGSIWFENSQGMHKYSTHMKPKEVKELAIRLAAISGQRLDESRPIMDGNLPNGIRVNAILDPISNSGTCISLRVKAANSFGVNELYTCRTLAPSLKTLFKTIVERKLSFLISGATGTGKTTVLSAFSQYFKDGERVIYIEEVSEIQPFSKNHVFLQSRQSNIENKGEISLSALVHAAMRMRPDRIILGECRGKEIVNILTAFNTGHEGGICTIHANSLHDVPNRLVALARLANMDSETTYFQAFSAFKVVFHLSRARVDNKIKRWISQIGIFELQNNKLQVLPCIEITKDNKVIFYKDFMKLIQLLKNK